LDKNALLWYSEEDDSLEIVEMAKQKSNWTENLNVGVFVSILGKLSALHAQDCVHGDIRLVNLLSTGHIVDFDFVGLDTYPEGLNRLSRDGKRHPQVDDAIDDGTIGQMKPEKEHDCYSMGSVLKLCSPETVWWKEATAALEKRSTRSSHRCVRRTRELSRYLEPSAT
jgi:serine/threonine protein kinase